MNQHMLVDPRLNEHKPEIYWPMLRTAEIVAARYGIPRERQDDYGARSQQRACAAQAAGHFTAEIAPITVTMAGVDKATSALYTRAGHDRRATRACARARRSRRSRRSGPATPGGTVAAGNASQFSDGAGACVVMSASEAARRKLKPLGIFRGFAIAGCEPDEMGIGPVFAIPKLLQRAGLKVEDIGLWELNEAFAVQVIYCRDKLGIPDDRLNVDGGAIAVGHPVRHDRPAPGRPCADRGQAARRQVRRRRRCASAAAWVRRGCSRSSEPRRDIAPAQRR